MFVLEDVAGNEKIGISEKALCERRGLSEDLRLSKIREDIIGLAP